MSRKEAYEYLSRIEAPSSALSALIELEHDYIETFAQIDHDLERGTLIASSFIVSIARKVLLEDLAEVKDAIRSMSNARRCRD